MINFLFSYLRQYVLKNPVFARSSNDQWAFGLFLMGSHLALWYELCHVLPHYYPETSGMAWVHYSAGVFIYLHWVISMYYFISTKTTGDFAELHNKQQDSWRYCTTCIEYLPPRSHHCPNCQACILKRDHHCWFGGCCVGYANHRYYCCMVVYIWLAAVYANIFHMSFLSDAMGGLGLGTWLCVLVPHVAGVTGFLTLYQFFVAGITFLAMFCLIMFSWLVLIQLQQLLKGQTMYEKKKGFTVYDQGFVLNAKDLFGDRWYLAWLLPWVPSALPGDGITFNKSTKDK